MVPNRIAPSKIGAKGEQARPSTHTGTQFSVVESAHGGMAVRYWRSLNASAVGPSRLSRVTPLRSFL
jgi:hypothetical protein